MSSTLENPREIYSTASNYLSNWNLVNFTCEEKTDIRKSITESGNYVYYIECPRTQYVFHQTVLLRFTDRDSYASADREPPLTLGAMTSYAASLSKVNLPNAIAPVSGNFLSAARIGNWMATRHSFSMPQEGVFQVEVEMIAYSDFVWHRSQCKKKQQAKAAIVSSASPEV